MALSSAHFKEFDGGMGKSINLIRRRSKGIAMKSLEIACRWLSSPFGYVARKGSAAGSIVVLRFPQEGKQVGHVLEAQSLFQADRHQREPCAGGAFDLCSRNRFLEVHAFHGHAGGLIGRDQSQECFVVRRQNCVLNVGRIDFTIRIEDIDQQFLRRTAGRKGQVRSYFVSRAAQTMTRSTKLAERFLTTS